MLTRRNLLRTAGVAGLGALTAPALLRSPASSAHAQTLPAGVVFDPQPFTLGVASGYPMRDSVVLWTRVAPEPLVADGGVHDPVPVRWAVASDRAGVAAELKREDPWGAPSRPSSGPLSTVVASGQVVAVAESGHSVHVEAGGLEPGGTYYYGFASEAGTSTIGRTRTAPEGPTEHLRFAVASCQHFAGGYFSAHRHIADEDVDFVLHLGDYVYEADAAGNGRVRRHIGGRVATPDEFRLRHALYKGDPDLRRAHAMHPWIMTWDDHEVRNNYAGSVHPSSVEQLRAAAYKAYYEHLPIRLTEDGPPSGSSFRIYQQAVFGDLLDVALTDTRQYRDIQPCTDEELPCPETYPDHPDRTILGAEQKAWLKELLATETAAWRVIATSVPFTQWQIGGVPQEAHEALNLATIPHFDKVAFNNDNWDSYTQERYELMQHILEQGKGSFVSLTGESHRHIWSHIRLDVDNPASPIALSEFGGTAITSDSGATNENDARLAVYTTSPHIRYLDSDHWGYLVCDVTRERWQTTARTLLHSRDPALDARFDPDATVFDDVVFQVDAGDPTMRLVSGENANPLPN